MKVVYIVFFVSLFLFACNRKNDGKKINNQNKPDTFSATRIDSLCFVKYSGFQNQDTATISLIIKNDQVSGRFTDFIYEKDGRIGTISGILTNGVIKGLWRYHQEGISDSIRVEFKMEGNRLLQRKSHFDPTTGREALSDTSTFSQVYQQVKCTH